MTSISTYEIVDSLLQQIGICLHSYAYKGHEKFYLLDMMTHDVLIEHQGVAKHFDSVVIKHYLTYFIKEMQTSITAFIVIDTTHNNYKVNRIVNPYLGTTTIEEMLVIKDLLP